jgi:four helix bundle protein
MDKGNKGYHKLIVWQKLRDLLLVTYKLIEKLPKSEDFGLKSQMRRAIVSVLSNFIEGYLKRSTKEKLHFMEIAETSLLELEAQSEICFLLTYWNERDVEVFEKKRGLAGYFLNRYKSKISP